MPLPVARWTASEVPHPAACEADRSPPSPAAVPALRNVPSVPEPDAPLPGTSPQCAPPAAMRKVVLRGYPLKSADLADSCLRLSAYGARSGDSCVASAGVAPVGPGLCWESV